MPATATLAASLLAVLVITAPLAAGGYRLVTLPVWVGLAGAAWFGLVVARWRSGRTLAVPLLSLILGAFAMLTALQAAPLGPLLAWFSPTAFEIRSFVAPEGRMAVSYELGATWREAAKLVVYALVAAVAHDAARRRTARRVLAPLVVAGVAATVGAAAHRILHLPALWGVFTADRAATELATTFFNPNHAGAFLVLTALTAAGLGVDAVRRGERALYLFAAAALAGASVLQPSKGGVLALVVGCAVFALLLFRRRSSTVVAAPVLFAGVLLPLVGVVLRLGAVVREFGAGPNAGPLGLGEKWAAVEGAYELVLRHPLTGIGRGAYISAYPQVQASDLQLIFAFPENLVAQLSSEWGAGFGLVALFALLYAVWARVARARKAHEIGAMAGVVALLVHDLVDFSLEMPGIAIPVAVILGALTPGRHTRTRSKGERPRWQVVLPSQLRPAQLELRGGAVAAALATAPVALAVLFTYGAFRNGDLQTDLDWLEAHGVDVARGASVDEAALAGISDRHPANVLVATQLAYIQEVRRPRRLRAALAYANRALFLGPRYADAHVLAGRLLLRAGHRQQAFGELRRAWQLSQGRADVMATARRWARNPPELLRAVPRSPTRIDAPAAGALLRFAQHALGAGDKKNALVALNALPPIEEVPPELLERVLSVALSLGDHDLAVAAGQRGSKLTPGGGMKLSLIRLAQAAGRTEEARTLAYEQDLGAVDVVELLELRLDLDLGVGDLEAAKRTLSELRRRLPVTRADQTKVALRAARIHMREGRPDQAVRELTKALDWSPAALDVRLLRGEALARLGRQGEAKVDVEYVLRRDPGHTAAKRLLQSLSLSD